MASEPLISIKDDVEFANAINEFSNKSLPSRIGCCESQ